MHVSLEERTDVIELFQATRPKHGVFELTPPLRQRFGDSFDAVMNVEGTVHRAKEGRRTVSFDCDGCEYFAKLHRGVGWREIAKNLLTLKAPVVDASNEWRAAARLHEAGVNTVEIVGKGLRGWNPARRESFVVMRALAERVEVEDLLKAQPPRRLRRLLSAKIAEATRRMHAHGVNHRDLYLCHFHAPARDWTRWNGEDDFDLPVLDLHRALVHPRVPRRWLVKDLGALLFSATECGASDRELVLFLKIYLGPGWKRQLRDEAPLWRAVRQRARAFLRRHRGHDVQFPGVFA